MKIVVIEPCENARIEEIEGELLEMQHIVGGYIESVPFEDIPGLVIVCDKDGNLKGLEDNFENFDDVICGTAFICRGGEEDFESLTDDEAQQVCEIFNSFEE